MIVHLVDGTYELFRHFYGLRRFNKGKDKPLGAVTGVLLSVVELIEQGATHIGVATDHVIESFRNDLWPGYKTGAGIEPALRAQLRLSLEPRPAEPDQLPFRKGRAIGWIEDALAPLRGRLPDLELRRLVLAIRATTGIEALVWLTDIAGLSRDEASELMRSSAHALLRDACRDEGVAQSASAR